METVFSTCQVAKITNVHHTTVFNWVKEGKINAYITPGGHRRIKKQDLLDFMKTYNIPIPDLKNSKKQEKRYFLWMMSLILGKK
ncbi:MAG: helix-turn-helix domain-containing protein [Candidatus Omnitrophota bacterium]